MIIVHDGKAHTDDFLATCVLIHKLNCRAIRTKCTQEHLEDKSCWVIDQGMSFDSEMHNFDHHHIKEEICSFTMILDYFYKKYEHFLTELTPLARSLATTQEETRRAKFQKLGGLHPGAS